jgi:hypothetical protein
METQKATPNMSAPIEIYLGKNGETFGPFTVAQFETMKTAPDFGSYTFIWDGREASPEWKPLESAPKPVAPKRGPGAPPPDATRVTVVPTEAVAAATPEAIQHQRRPALRGYDVPHFEVVCHDARSVITGRIKGVTDAGCEFVADQSKADAVFGAGSPVLLNLLDPATGRSTNVNARLNGVRRQNGGWCYRVVWKACPELILQHLEKTA